MKQQKLAATIWMIGIILSIALVAGETIEIGPTKVFIDTENIGSYSIVKGDPSSSDHKEPDFQYGIYTASLDSNNSSNQVLIEVHQMSISNPLDTPISKKDITTAWSIAFKGLI